MKKTVNFHTKWLYVCRTIFHQQFLYNLREKNPFTSQMALFYSCNSSFVGIQSGHDNENTKMKERNQRSTVSTSITTIFPHFLQLFFLLNQIKSQHKLSLSQLEYWNCVIYVIFVFMLSVPCIYAIFFSDYNNTQLYAGYCCCMCLCRFTRATESLLSSMIFLFVCAHEISLHWYSVRVISLIFHHVF